MRRRPNGLWRTAAVVGWMALSASTFAGEALLTDNERAGWVSNTFPKDEPRLKTGATLTWVTDGEFATKSDELLKTGSRPDGQNRVLLDGRRGTEGDCQAFGNWGKQYYGTFVVDLQKPYLVTRAAVWSQQTKTQGVGSFELLLSADGKEYVTVGSVTPAEDLLNQTEKLGEPITLKLEKPALARYAQFRVLKHKARMQMILSEAALWGEAPPADAAPADLAALRPENQRPDVPLRLHGVGSGALKLDWGGFGAASQVQKYRLYAASEPFGRVDASDIERLGEYDAKTTRTLLYPLAPGSSRHYGVTAVYAEGEAMGVKSVGYAVPDVLAGRGKTLGDMLAVNHFWGGGGARHGKKPREWEMVALDMLAETPFREIRWWESHPDIVKLFYERGLGVSTFSGERNLKNAPALGIHLFGSGNEPHLRGTRPEVHAETVRKLRADLAAAVPAAKLYAPTVCIDNHSLDWLDRFYAAGAKDHFDAVDVHTYLGNTSDFVYPPGYPAGSPEGLLERVGRIRDIMKKHGDADKPLISTEFGYTDTNVANPVGSMTPERKAAFLARGLILHHVLGFARVYVYSFWDEGDDPNYTEHHFGLLDARFQRKPAFYAVKTLGDVLGDAAFDRPMDGADAANHGYVYRDPADAGRVVTAVWNGAGPHSATFRLPAGSAVEIVSTLGERRRLVVGADGTFRTRIGPGPVYLVADAPAALAASVPVDARPDADAVSLASARPVVVTGAGRDPGIVLDLVNPTREAVSARLALSTADGKEIAARDVSLAAGERRAETFPVPAGAAGTILDRYAASIRYEGKYETRSATAPLYVRRLAAAAGVSTARMAGYKHEVFVLADEALELTVDPRRGGRILELFDRRTGENQVTLDYERLGGLENVSFYYCIWDEVKAPRGKGVGRNAVYDAKPLDDAVGLELSAGGADGVGIVKRLTLGGGGGLELAVRLVNRGAEPVACSYYMHPEYTVGGTADSHSDLLRLPLDGGEATIPYWSGLGDRPTGAFTAGYWVLEDPAAKYRIRQEFSLDAFRKPRLWFGIGCCNLEMESARGLTLPPGGDWNGTLRWTFGNF